MADVSASSSASSSRASSATCLADGGDGPTSTPARAVRARRRAPARDRRPDDRRARGRAGRPRSGRRAAPCMKRTVAAGGRRRRWSSAVVVWLHRCTVAPGPRGPGARRPAGSRTRVAIEPVFDPDGPVLGIDPGVSRCGYGAVRRDGPAPVAVACGVIRTPRRGRRCPARLAVLERELDDARRASSRPSALAVERVLFQVNVRTAMSVGQASGSRSRPRRAPGIPVVALQPERGEARGHRRRRRRQGAGAGDGHAAAAPRRAAATARRRRRARPRAVSPVAGAACARRADGRRRVHGRTRAPDGRSRAALAREEAS